MKEKKEVLEVLMEIKELLEKIYDELQRKPPYIVIPSPPYHYSGPTWSATYEDTGGGCQCRRSSSFQGNCYG